MNLFTQICLIVLMASVVGVMFVGSVFAIMSLIKSIIELVKEN